MQGIQIDVAKVVHHINQKLVLKKAGSKWSLMAEVPRESSVDSIIVIRSIRSRIPGGDAGANQVYFGIHVIHTAKVDQSGPKTVIRPKGNIIGFTALSCGRDIA